MTAWSIVHEGHQREKRRRRHHATATGGEDKPETQRIVIQPGPEQNKHSTLQTDVLLYMYRGAPLSHIWHSLGACVEQTG